MELLLNAQQMKACDARTIGLGIPSAVLMERAAMAVVDEMEQASLDLSRVLVVCGSGNNGGDGFAAARMLAYTPEGWKKQEHSCAYSSGMPDTKTERVRQVDVWFVGREASMTKETALQRRICENCGLKISSNFPAAEYTTIVDAMFGIGLSRAVEGRYAQAVAWINAQAAQVVAVDLPSGLSADSGQVLGCAVRADLTVTFAARKPGQILYPGAEYCGRLVCRDIGIPAGWKEVAADTGEMSAANAQGSSPHIFTYTRQDLSRLPKRSPASHKGTYGKVLLIAGSEGMSGAAVLSARGAFRSGCGMVRVFTAACNRIVIQTALPEAMVTTWEPGGRNLEHLAEALAWSDVVGIGPGLGTSAAAWELLEYVLCHCAKPLVMDADALNLLAAHFSAGMPSGKAAVGGQTESAALTGDGQVKRSWAVPDSLRGKVVLTPHIGEMARLAGKEKQTISADPIGTAQRFAKTCEVICVLKDARTVVSDGQQVYLNTSGNHGMAVAGSGDVLSGVLCGLLAQGMPAFDAAALGVYLHGLAGDAARDELGAYGMMAGDIADAVGKVMRDR
ncbi:MAG: NAD(P)H-hydrate dehydratase [Lachnospiraceae bacterium]|nr:NAD(P)H-hydrate dehydratase [Lachnospiraceae bacterium]